MDIILIAFLTWAFVQLFPREPARTIILVVGIVLAIAGTFWVHWGHTVVVR